MGASKTLKNAQNTQQQIASTDLSRSTDLYNQSGENYKKAAQTLDPGISFYSGLASGDPNKMLEAAAVPLGNISKSAASARGAIEDTVAPGAARNFALAGLKRDQAGQSSSLLNQAYLSAFPALQGISQQLAGYGSTQLQGSSGYQGQGQNANNQVIQTEQQKRQSKLNTIGTFAGIAGGAINPLTKLFGGSKTVASSPFGTYNQNGDQ